MENKNNVSFPDEKSDWDDWAEEERLRDEAYDRAHPEEEQVVNLVNKLISEQDFQTYYSSTYKS